MVSLVIYYNFIIFELVSTYNYFILGITGEVHISAEGDRYPLLVLHSLQIVDKKIKFIHGYHYDTYYNRFKTVSNGVTRWPGGGTAVPAYQPKCGFDGKLCAKRKCLFKCFKLK